MAMKGGRPLEESILKTVRAYVGLDASDTSFDQELIIDTNTIFLALNQFGIGPKKCFRINGPQESWREFLGEREDLDAVKECICIRVRLVFDPPSSAQVKESLSSTADQIEWRLREQAERKDDDEE
jgi:hypothetical protein